MHFTAICPAYDSVQFQIMYLLYSTGSRQCTLTNNIHYCSKVLALDSVHLPITYITVVKYWLSRVTTERDDLKTRTDLDPETTTQEYLYSEE